MVRIKRFMLVVQVAGFLVVGTATAESIKGLYLVVRKREPSEQNSKLPKIGDMAVLAWKVSQGTYQGTSLDDLAVVALVCADRSLGSDENVKTRTTFLVDERATQPQRAALVTMAKAAAKKTIQQVVEIRPVKIELMVCEGCAKGYASLKTDSVIIRTRRLLDSDKPESGSETTANPILAELYYRSPALALKFSYSGHDFAGKAVHYDQKDLRSAAVGGFWF